MIGAMAKWVSGREDCEAPIIFGEIQADFVPEKAQISICGLGFFELYINGKKVSGDLCVPAWSDYEPRRNRRMLYPLGDTFSHRIYYLDYDLTGLLQKGANRLEVWLGNGWYNQHERNIEGDFWYDRPKLAYTIEAQGSQGQRQAWYSDENLRWKKSPIVFNNVYLGEKWDYDQGKEQTGEPVCLAVRPESPLCLQECPPDREIETLTPRCLWRKGDRALYDAGENLTGYAVCEGQGHVRICYGEEIDESVSLSFASAGGEGQIQCDEYDTEQKRTLRPKFSLKGFRYFEIEGKAENVKAVRVHCDIKITSYFHSDNETLNWLYDVYIRTQLNNMHYGIVSDCPHRERLGYTGDGQLTCNAALLLLDSAGLYKKWIRDILDCQDPVSGHVQHTAPFYGGGGGPGGWGSAVVMVPYFYYLHQGDLTFLQECYPSMLKWFFYMQSRLTNGLITAEEAGGWCLGDWCTPQPVQIPEALVNTYFYCKAMERLLWLGSELKEKLPALCREDGKGLEKAERELLENLHQEEIFTQREKCLQAMRRTWYRKEEGRVQGGAAFLADLGIAEEGDLEALHRQYADKGAYDTGIFGTYVLTRLLFEKGFAETAFGLLTSENIVSFYHMKEAGATTLWENWNGDESHDHPMFGAVTDCLFEWILGIRPEAPGYGAIKIEPCIPAGLSHVEGRVTTRAGRVEVRYLRGQRQEFKIFAPGVPTVFVWKGNRMVLQAGWNSLRF